MILSSAQGRVRHLVLEDRLDVDQRATVTVEESA